VFIKNQGVAASVGSH